MRRMVEFGFTEGNVQCEWRVEGCRDLSARLRNADRAGRFPPGPLKSCRTGQLRSQTLELYQAPQPCCIAAKPRDCYLSLRIYEGQLLPIFAPKSKHHANTKPSASRGHWARGQYPQKRP